MAYLSSYFSDAHSHFEAFLVPQMGQPSFKLWFEHDGKPLKWHLPLGVLCDLLFGTEPPSPVDITVHFFGCPDKAPVEPFTGLSDLQKAWSHELRASLYLQLGSSNVWARLQRQEQQKLWEAVKNIDLETVASMQDGLLAGRTFKRARNLAFRFHIPSAADPHRMLLLPGPAFTEAGGQITLQTFLEEALPPIFEAGRMVEGVEVLSQGLRIPLETPLWWLQVNVAYMDQFVHLVIRLPSSSDA